MPYAHIEDGIQLYYEFTGPEDAPVILQFGGGLFGRHNFGLVNDGFRERFRLISFDARGYGASDHPREQYTIDGWAEDGLYDRRKTAQPIAGALVDAEILQALGQFGRSGQFGIVLQAFVKDIIPGYRAKPVAKLLMR